MTSTSNRTRSVRHNFDQAKLKTYLDTIAPRCIPGCDIRECTMSVRQFNAGQSNPTYLLSFHPSSRNSTSTASDEETRCVLRKRPHGVNVASAHNVAREYAVLKALGEDSWALRRVEPRTVQLDEVDATYQSTVVVVD